jgi:hypothetical protein
VLGKSSYLLCFGDKSIHTFRKFLRKARDIIEGGVGVCKNLFLQQAEKSSFSITTGLESSTQEGGPLVIKLPSKDS